MIINHNMASLNTYRQLSSNNNATSKSLEKLSSGLRINRAGDDAAGLAISEKMRGQIRGLDQATRNAQDSISLIQTAEGALNETHSILQRMRELAVQASNDTNTTSDRDEIQKEVNALTDEIDRIANTTEFNTQKLLDGSKTGLRDEIKGTVTVQLNTQADVTVTLSSASITSTITATGTIVITRTKIGTGISGSNYTVGDPNALGISSGDITGAALSALAFGGGSFDVSGLENLKVGESITISFRKYEAEVTDSADSLSMQIGANSGQNILVGLNDMKATAIGVRDDASGDALDMSTSLNATAAVTSINNAIELVSGERSKMGAIQNRLEHTINNLGTSSENLTAAESRVRDVDMAKEMMNFQKNNILSQAATAMLAQANQQPQGVLQLLQ
ncbi:flagellin N-terminal helical domain-containing protein [Desulfosporosinus nitroreducens]|uniref:flagellin N-terminal helical domain-containing protein n=1 Tax=Desulfosporosinus nitroreducens TaxID=2018668 RepID=UPI00207D403E|nr:flagellin [Desulfosporosinus nitroreducens]MCO1601333.1 flagellin [Desulfosporosinus nitroreducens]